MNSTKQILKLSNNIFNTYILFADKSIFHLRKEEVFLSVLIFQRKIY